MLEDKRKGGEKKCAQRREGEEMNEGGSLVCATLIEFFFHVRRNSFAGELPAPARSLVRSLPRPFPLPPAALCVSAETFSNPLLRSSRPLLRRCVNRITASIQRAIARCSGDSRAASIYGMQFTEDNAPR